MRLNLLIIVCLLSLILLSCQDKNVSPKQKSPTKDVFLKSASAQIYFDGDCSQAVLEEICDAKSSIFVQSVFVDSPVIAAALIDAHKAGVKVEAIIGKYPRKKKDNTVASMAKAGIPVYIDKRANWREDVLSIDGKTIITGSFHCSDSAGNSDIPRLTVTKSVEFAAVNMENWKRRKEYATTYRVKPEPQKTTYKRRP